MQCSVKARLRIALHMHLYLSSSHAAVSRAMQTSSWRINCIHSRPGPVFLAINMSYHHPLSSIILLLHCQRCAVPLGTPVVRATHCGSLPYITCSLVWCRIWTCRLRWLQRLGHRLGRRASLWLPPLESHPASAGCRSAAWLLTMWLQETSPLLCDYSTGTLAGFLYFSLATKLIAA